MRPQDLLRANEQLFELWARQKKDGIRDIREGGPILVLTAQTTPPPNMIQGWQPFEFPYPSTIQFIEDGTTGGMRGVVLAMPFEQHDAFDFGAVPAIRSHNAKLTIPYPGKWYLIYLRADAAIDTGIFGVILDDTCGIMDEQRRKKHTGIVESTVTVSSAAATNITNGDHTPQTCDGQVIQNIGSVDVWLRFGTAGLAPASVGVGIVLPSRSSIELVDALAYPWPVNGRADGANCDVRLLKLVS